MFQNAVGIIAFIVTLVGLVAALGYVGYLVQLKRVATTRAGGDAAIARVDKRLPLSYGLAGVAALGFLVAMATGIPGDIVSMILSGGAGVAALGQMQRANKSL